MLAVLVAHFLPKFVIYILWCYLALRIRRPGEEALFSTATVYGFYRLLIGFAFGALVFFAVIGWAAGHGDPSKLDYVLIYLPILWIEWTIMAIIIIPGANSAARWFTGLDRSDRVWRLGGIAVSFLGDGFLLFLTDHIEVGRILC
jgi:hypothetical protein